MGEILRAICDASCITKRPAFYTGRISSTPTAGARTYAPRQTVIQLKSDTFFLLMYWTQEITLALPSVLSWEQKVAASTFTLRNMKSSKQYAVPPVMKSNAGYNLNNPVALPHYILWEPSDLIGIISDVPITDATGSTQADTFITLTGIEYQMPSGRP